MVAESFVEIAKATPATRDRYVDFLRALSIIVVIFGHWLIAVVYRTGNEFTGTNALAVIPYLWLATWLFQVMPVFFFVGGFSNLVTWEATLRRGGGYSAFLNGRVERLLRPTAVFILAWIIAALMMERVFSLPSELVRLATGLVARPLWFIGIYLIVIVLSPPMIRVHRKYGLRALVAMAAGALFIDVARLALEVPYIGYLNFAFVWLFTHQLGFFYADGSLQRGGHRAHLALAVSGLAGLAFLTAGGPYPGSMVGLPGDTVSNMDPPSICILALTIWQVGLVMLLRACTTRWLARVRVWAAVIAMNSVIMSVFLWHLTALLIGVGVLYPIGFPQPIAGAADWWALRPVWVAALIALLAPFVLLLGRLERPEVRRSAS